jgi:hypothetical protein
MMSVNHDGAACVHDTPSLEWTLRSTASDFLYLLSTQEYCFDNFVCADPESSILQNIIILNNDELVDYNSLTRLR